ncbi:ketopantoate reductase family protein [Blastococcus sp. SYSU D00669]
MTGQRVLVLGAGGIGGLLAARLADDPELSVSIAVRRPTPALSFTAHGSLTLPPVDVVTSAESLGPVDWVVVATKAYDVAGIAPWLGAPACEGARIAIAQNGVEQVERVAPYAPLDLLLPVIVTYGAERPGPGEIVQTLAGTTRVPSGPLGAAFAAMAARSSLAVDVVEDFPTALWTKLAWNLVGNSLSTITDLPVREIGRRPELRALATRLVEECAAVARCEGATLEPDLVEGMLDVFAGFPTTVRSSMWQDRRAGRPLEHDAISGAVVRGGERRGIETPYSQMATLLLASLGEGR